MLKRGSAAANVAGCLHSTYVTTFTYLIYRRTPFFCSILHRRTDNELLRTAHFQSTLPICARLLCSVSLAIILQQHLPRVQALQGFGLMPSSSSISMKMEGSNFPNDTQPRQFQRVSLVRRRWKFSSGRRQKASVTGAPSLITFTHPAGGGVVIREPMRDLCLRLNCLRSRFP